MTEMEKLLGRMTIDKRNSIRVLRGEPLLPIPTEFMTKEELLKILEAKSVRNYETEEDEKDIITVTPVEVKEEVKKPIVKKIIETKKEETIKEAKDKENSQEKDKENSLKSTVDFLKNKLQKLAISEEEVIEENQVKEDKEKTVETKPVIDEDEKEENVEINKATLQKVELVKTKIGKIVEEVKSFKPENILIKDYRKMTSSKKKAAIANMLKSLANEIAKEKQCDVSEVLNFATNIPTVANQHNRREYNNMLTSLKETLSKMTSSTIIEGIITRLDKELKNIILMNKVKFVTFIKNMNTDLELTEENLDKVSSELDSCIARLNNGEDFDKILNSFDKNITLENNHIEAKVVDTDEKVNEDESVEFEDDSAENVFLTMEEVDSLASTMNEVLMGI